MFHYMLVLSPCFFEVMYFKANNFFFFDEIFLGRQLVLTIMYIQSAC